MLVPDLVDPLPNRISQELYFEFVCTCIAKGALVRLFIATYKASLYV